MNARGSHGPPSRRVAVSIEHGKARNANALNVVDARTLFVPADREEHEARHRIQGRETSGRGSWSNPAEKYATRRTTNGIGLGGSPPMARRRRRLARIIGCLPGSGAVQRRLKLVNVGSVRAQDSSRLRRRVVEEERRAEREEDRRYERARRKSATSTALSEEEGKQDEDDATPLDAERSRSPTRSPP